MVKLFRQAPFGKEVSGVQDGLIRLRGGAPRAVVATSSLNFHGLAPEQQSRSVQAFRDLLHAQSGPLQLYLRIRRLSAGDAHEPDRAGFADAPGYFGALTRSFINAHLQDTPVYQRESFIVLGPADASRQLLRSWLFRFDRSSDQPSIIASDLGTPLRLRAQALIEQLRRIGIQGRLLDDDGLAELLAGLNGRGRAAGDPGTQRQAFAHRADSVEINGRHYASFVVNRYPGEEVEPGWLLPLVSFNGELHV